MAHLAFFDLRYFFICIVDYTGNMNTKRFLILLLLFLSSLDIAYAATLHGKVYDIELNELNNVVVEVDSQPNQRYVSKDGAYSFELEPGNYIITANYSSDRLQEYTTSENISIKNKGDYVYDLFLLPSLETDDDLILEDKDGIELSDVFVEDNKENKSIYYIFISFFIILLVLAYFLLRREQYNAEKKELEEVDKAVELAEKLEKKEMGIVDSELDRLIDIIKKEGGRTTQKELRKNIPLSEAKISLMISELEHKKIIEKVKKGRGNIIILKK